MPNTQDSDDSDSDDNSSNDDSSTDMPTPTDPPATTAPPATILATSPTQELSQTANARFTELAFYVEANHPDRLEEFRILLKNAISTNEDPIALRTHIQRWTHPPNE
jgi:hypothetical protein